MKKIKCFFVGLAVVFMAAGMTGCGEKSVGIDMVQIPGQNFKMLKTEITQGIYKSVMIDNPSWCDRENDNKPVENVSWNDAIYFCNKLSEQKGLTPVYAVDGQTDVTQWNYTPHLFNEISGTVTQNTEANGYRLPTIEEWKYAAKGGQDFAFAGSDKIEDVAWTSESNLSGTQPVAKKKANGYGLYDMCGNVYEWVWDIDPEWGSIVRYYIGGSWNDNYLECMPEKMLSGGVESKLPTRGFRIVCSSN